VSAPAPIRIGTRGSALALWQADHVAAQLRTAGRRVDIRRITTTGDRILDRRLETVGGKAAFLKEIEEALVAREVDLAVHSLKDVPTALPPGLVLCAFLPREDPRDAVLSRENKTLAGLARGARVGTTSLRRAALIKELRKDLVIEDLRGNVDSRIRRLREGKFDAILLAMAGLVRLGRAGEVAEALNPVQFIPAPGQGVIGLECRAGDTAVQEATAPLHHPSTARSVEAERAVLAALGGSCNVPMGAYADGNGRTLRLWGFLARPDGSRMVRAHVDGDDPQAIGRQLADELVGWGGAPLSRT
jgi:hydroxymethylbilane synthase